MYGKYFFFPDCFRFLFAKIWTLKLGFKLWFNHWTNTQGLRQFIYFYIVGVQRNLVNHFDEYCYQEVAYHMVCVYYIRLDDIWYDLRPFIHQMLGINLVVLATSPTLLPLCIILLCHKILIKMKQWINVGFHIKDFYW